jgi:hypothetical protein
VPRVFEFSGFPDETIEAVKAAVSVASGGAIYPDAILIDNVSGEPAAFATVGE